ncbi:MAG: hypothetical protein WC848_02615 [Parcubacteria group bacterium]|jgi:hypothetical protein
MIAAEFKERAEALALCVNNPFELLFFVTETKSWPKELEDGDRFSPEEAEKLIRETGIKEHSQKITVVFSPTGNPVELKVFVFPDQSVILWDDQEMGGDFVTAQSFEELEEFFAYEDDED